MLDAHCRRALSHFGVLRGGCFRAASKQGQSDGERGKERTHDGHRTLQFEASARQIGSTRNTTCASAGAAALNSGSSVILWLHARTVSSMRSILCWLFSAKATASAWPASATPE